MIYLVVIFVLLGALLQSHNVMKTIGKGVVLNPLNMKAVFTAMLSAGFYSLLWQLSSKYSYPPLKPSWERSSEWAWSKEFKL